MSLKSSRLQMHLLRLCLGGCVVIRKVLARSCCQNHQMIAHCLKVPQDLVQRMIKNFCRSSTTSRNIPRIGHHCQPANGVEVNQASDSFRGGVRNIFIEDMELRHATNQRWGEKTLASVLHSHTRRAVAHEILAEGLNAHIAYEHLCTPLHFARISRHVKKKRPGFAHSLIVSDRSRSRGNAICRQTKPKNRYRTHRCDNSGRPFTNSPKHQSLRTEYPGHLSTPLQVYGWCR